MSDDTTAPAARDAIQRLLAGIRISTKQDFGEFTEVIETLIGTLDKQGMPAVKEQYKAFIRSDSKLLELMQDDEHLYPVITLDEHDLKRIDRYPYTDFGQAEALVDVYKEFLRYSPALGWIVWTGSRWAMDDRRAVIQAAAVVARARQRAIQARPINSENKDELSRKVNDYKQALKAENRSRLDAAVNLAESMPHIVIEADELDSDRYTFGAANGVIDLITSKLLEPRQRDYMTKRTNIPYYPEAQCPRWELFISEIFGGNQELITYVHRSLGYSLTGDTSEQCFWILYGLGSNGKSTFLDIVRRIGGDYSSNAPFNTFTQGKETNTGDDIARLRGQRLVTSSETKEGSALNEERVKSITGGDPLTGRFLYGKWFTFTPQFKVWLAVNHKPVIKGTDRGIWRRVRLIPFTVSFEGRADKGLAAKLEDELPGILAWFVRGAVAWRKHGLETPTQVQAATEAYQNEMDIIGQFIEECCVKQAKATVKASQLYEAYRNWTEENGMKPLSSIKFSKAMQERGKAKERLRTGEHWQGIGLLYNDEV